VLRSVDLRWHAGAGVCVVIAARAGVTSPSRQRNRRPRRAVVDPKVKIFHAGTHHEGKRFVADGGHVFGLTSLGPDLKGAREGAMLQPTAPIGSKALPPRHRRPALN
jgi:phosphoribosylamine-glycine ligase